MHAPTTPCILVPVALGMHVHVYSSIMSCSEFNYGFMEGGNYGFTDGGGEASSEGRLTASIVVSIVAALVVVLINTPREEKV